MKVGVVILNYNSSTDCRKCIGSLRQQENADMEIIVVDNNSGDAEQARQFCADEGVTFIGSKVNKGYSAGNNIGLRYAAEQGCKYVMIANPDMEFPQKDYVSKLVSCLENDKEIVVAGTDIIGPDGIHQNPMFRDGDWRESFGWIKDILQRNKPSDAYHFIDHYEENHYCHKLVGCCLMVRLSFLQRIGFFDEYPFLYCEEAILSRSVEREGFKMYYTADIQAVHRHIKSEKGNPVKRFKEFRRSRLYFIERYSADSWFGKQIAKLSVKMHIVLMILIMKIKR